MTVSSFLSDALGRLSVGAWRWRGSDDDDDAGAWNVEWSTVVLIASGTFLFWPLIVGLLASAATASAWLFWLLTSSAFGVVQFFYVVYQFGMVSTDLAGLTLLKTATTLRSQFLYVFGLLGLTTKEGSRKGRARRWRKRVDAASSWSEYRAIALEEPEGRPRRSDDKESGDDERERSHARSALSSWLRFGRTSNDESATTKTTTTTTTTTERSSSDDSSETPTPRNGERAEGSRRERRTLRRRHHKSADMKRSQSCIALVQKNVDVEDDDANDFYVSSSLATAKENEQKRSSSSLNVLFEARERGDASARVGARGASSSHDDDDDTSSLGRTGDMLTATTERIREARLQAGRDGDASSLKFLLSGVVKRNHLHVDDFLLNDARSVDHEGRHLLSRKDRAVAEDFADELDRCLRWLTESLTSLPHTSTTTNYSNNSNNNNTDNDDNDDDREADELADRLRLLRKARMNLGCTALMLSGGGAQAMYHLGIVRALIESGLYQQFPVISGTSGGSITAAVCATCTPEELLRDVCVPTVSTDYRRTGEMGRRDIRWFPPLSRMGAYWARNGLLVDSEDFRRCCEFYWGDVTFEEAFRRTGKHVCITVSASRGNGGAGAQRLLLNHISTPHVTLASAVGASCALPGVMRPARLVCRIGDERVPFEVDGSEWIDGSVQADLPFERISTLFNVTEYVVCQCNFHVVPLLNKAHHPDKRSAYWRLFQSLEWDVRSRVLNLSRLGLFPTIFGQDISKVFKQKYHGRLTLVPRFTRAQVFGLQALSNPTVEDMRIYLRFGQIAAWPYVDVMAHMLRLETSLRTCIAALEARLESAVGDVVVADGASSLDGGSTASRSSRGSNRRSSRRRESAATTERTERRNRKLESENAILRRKVEMLERTLGIHDGETEHDDDREEEEETEKAETEEAGVGDLIDTTVVGEEKKDEGSAVGDSPISSDDDDNGDAKWEVVRGRR